MALVYYFSNNWKTIKEDTQSTTLVNAKHKLQFSFRSGFYTEPISLEITNPKSDSCTIFYSLNFTIPNHSSKKYGGPIQLDFSNNVSNEVAHSQHRATVIRSIAYQNGKPISWVRTGVFFIDSTIFSKYPYPILSLVTEPASTFGGDTIEVSAHVTLVKNNGVLSISQNAGLRILENPFKQPGLGLIELISRKKYGTRYFDYPIFKHNDNPKIQGFALRKLKNSGSNLITDGMNSLNIDTAEFNPYVVYLNGSCDGIYISEVLTTDRISFHAR